MTGDPISPRVQRLLLRHFRAVSEVETFVLLARSAGHCSAEEVAASIGLGLGHVTGILEALVSTGLVTKDDNRYDLAPMTAERRAATEELVGLYARYRLRIIDIVLGARRDPAADFANAFRLRNDDDVDDEEGD